LGRLTLQTSNPTLPKTVDRLGRRVFSGLVVATFVLAGTTLLALGRQEILGYVLLAFGCLVLLGHVGLDLIRRG
jgi:ubiquinone biosynthesis protein